MLYATVEITRYLCLSVVNGRLTRQASPFFFYIILIIDDIRYADTKIWLIKQSTKIQWQIYQKHHSADIRIIIKNAIICQILNTRKRQKLSTNNTSRICRCPTSACWTSACARIAIK
jgi:hypothetical protein